ncbi:hypothetical protein I8752_29685 [Nostocaceae cyanobacterium CENA369]|uniref:Uncharacterized protein n=1 Tax=Dendronalium phyllosphericum CENA369 TaxID=1725256 RepID=A0A8J7I6Q6_9NOST|nr:hypothetical protein [Dendronalium phyllosphericum]MBH8577081.1 hypothetical protein [Dendronalium phyllosphericum CENA369]
MKKVIDSIDTALHATAIALLLSVGLFGSAALICHGLSIMATNSAQNTLMSRVNWAKQREFSIGGIFVCGGGFLASALARAALYGNEE